MAVKGTIARDHMPKNKYVLEFFGMPPITITKVTGAESEVSTVVLPDQTVVSGGLRFVEEFDIEVPMHHTSEIAAMEAWIDENEDPIPPTAKKTGLLVAKSGSGLNLRTWRIEGAIAIKRSLPDFDMSNEGEMQVNTYTIKCDAIRLQS